MNNSKEILFFELLKKSISECFFKDNSASSTNISEWKGHDIVNFQEDLLKKTKSTVSEKWFYTYFKSDFKKLPRIDMLNILSQYVGYTSWADFIRRKEIEINEENNRFDEIKEEIPQESEIKNPTKKKKNRAWVAVLVISVFLITALGIGVYYLFFYQRTYEFCFVDADRNTPIKNTVEVTIARHGFSPLNLTTRTGCIEFSSYGDTLRMFVSSPYHKPDTFLVNLHQYRERENIKLVPDDYKVMLYYYSQSSQSVKERIENLNKLIANDALIYQVFDNEYFGVEVLSKKQYINLVSLPTTSLKNFSLIESEMKNGRIVKIKFKIQSDES